MRLRAWALFSQEALLLASLCSCDAHSCPLASGTRRCRHIHSSSQQDLSASEERERTNKKMRDLGEKIPLCPALPSSCLRTLASLTSLGRSDQWDTFSCSCCRAKALLSIQCTGSNKCSLVLRPNSNEERRVNLRKGKLPQATGQCQ